MHYVHTRDLLCLFKNGYDTAQIANITKLPESHVYNQLHEQREAERQRTYQRDYQRRLREDFNSDEPY